MSSKRQYHRSRSQKSVYTGQCTKPKNITIITQRHREYRTVRTQWSQADRTWSNEIWSSPGRVHLGEGSSMEISALNPYNSWNQRNTVTSIEEWVSCACTTIRRHYASLQLQPPGSYQSQSFARSALHLLSSCTWLSFNDRDDTCKQCLLSQGKFCTAAKASLVYKCHRRERSLKGRTAKRTVRRQSRCFAVCMTVSIRCAPHGIKDISQSLTFL